MFPARHPSARVKLPHPMHPAPTECSLAQRLQERIAQSRFFTFSLLLHSVIVVLAGSAVLFHRSQPAPDFAPPGGVVLEAVEKVAEPVMPAGNFLQPDPPPAAQPVSAHPLPNLIVTNAPAKHPALALAQVSVKIRENLGPSEKPAVQPSTRGAPGEMVHRFGTAVRQKAAMKAGGKDRSEQAVMAGLRWLKERQNADGSWSDEFRPAMTGLALLAFLGHGELPESPEFGPAVKKALDWVLERGTEFDGRMSLTKGGWGGNHGVYEHAILTYAMGEYFSMTKDARFEPLLRKAVACIVEGQTPLGGWDYHYAKGPRNDLSVAGWQIQALKAAHLTGLGLPGVDDALDRSMGFLKKWQGNEGGFGYVGPENRLSLTGVGVLCTYFWKQSKDRTVNQGIDFLLGKAEVKYQGGSADLYGWYYDTQACLMYGGSAWTKWNRMFQDEIVDHQSPDGSWPATAGGHLQPKPAGAGPFYRTTLCVLMLEVFYRYMPANK